MDDLIWVNKDARGRKSYQEMRHDRFLGSRSHSPTPVLKGFIKCLSCSLYTRKTAPKCWKVNNFRWHLHILQYANEGSCKSQIARREKRRWREEKEGGSRGEKKETDGGWCKLWMQPAISKRERKAERNLKSCISDCAFATFSYHGR